MTGAVAQGTGSMVDMAQPGGGSRKASVSGEAGPEQEFPRSRGGIALNFREMQPQVHRWQIYWILSAFKENANQWGMQPNGL